MIARKEFRHNPEAQEMEEPLFFRKKTKSVFTAIHAIEASWPVLLPNSVCLVTHCLRNGTSAPAELEGKSDLKSRTGLASY